MAEKKDKLKAEDIVKVRDRFLSKFPQAIIGFLENRDKGVVCIEARVISDLDAKDIPSEFEGFTVNKSVVSKKKYNMLKETFEAMAHKR